MEVETVVLSLPCFNARVIVECDWKRKGNSGCDLCPICGLKHTALNRIQ